MKRILLFSIALITLGYVQAQVTIGSAKAPLKGALLMLDDETTGSSNENAQKGLGLPRVELTNLTPQNGTELASSIGNAGDWNIEEHIGLLVYNMKVDEDVCKPPHLQISAGLYVWDGKEWVAMNNQQGKHPEVQVFTDVRNNEVYHYRKFGNAGEWMLENLRYVPKVEDGYSNFSHSVADAITSKTYAYPEGDENPYIPANHPTAAWNTENEWESTRKNGLLYSWLGATNGENTATDDQGQLADGSDPTPQTRGVCPPNWHLPSDKEWNDLEREVYNNAHLYSSYTQEETATWANWNPTWETSVGVRPGTTATEGHGAAMKFPCPPLGSSMATNGKSLSAMQGGFHVLLVAYGFAGAQGYTSNYGEMGQFWTSSFTRVGAGGGSGAAPSSYSRDFWESRFGAYRSPRNFTYSFSVRCKKN